MAKQPNTERGLGYRRGQPGGAGTHFIEPMHAKPVTELPPVGSGHLRSNSMAIDALPLSGARRNSLLPKQENF